MAAGGAGGRRPGSLLTFNVDDGYAEALTRGLRSGFLSDDDYHHLQRCESIEGACCAPCVRRAPAARHGWGGRGRGRGGCRHAAMPCAPVRPLPRERRARSACSPDPMHVWKRVRLCACLGADVKLNLQETDYGNFLQNDVRALRAPARSPPRLFCAPSLSPSLPVAARCACG